MNTPASDTAEVWRGTAYGALAYLLWGVLPLYFALLIPATPWEVLGHRVLWSLLICGALLALAGQLRWAIDMFRDRRLLLTMTAAGALIAINWTVYTVAVMSGHVTEAALGYFLNPLVTVAMGVLLLRERLRPAQWVAVGAGLVAGVYLTINYGTLPWISLTLAFSFATYGLIKKHIGSSLSAVQSLTGETVVMAPLAVGIIIWLGVTDQQTFVGEGAGHTTLLVLTGVITAVPLLLFAAAAHRVPLVTIGLLQFIAPVLQLLGGVLVLGEVMPTSRWVGFGLVWVALIILSVDSVVSSGRSRRLARAAEGAAV
ncbi:EamA family transporter RarD [Ornithinimicrobium faecis]|uniref:EamA family transporter RarD n=1 Tax=Ornithinimicrobium faecis TaxID=2934158 RepID=A0ABY4YWI7_9MICO|nr:EamA family transporter RarD [Ornithinimicrobium sp. HY1793]USQ80835.1 EamA family transporter RarD [Ornithinimicrobium sp. HY1793]